MSVPGTPRFPDIGVLALVPDHWGVVWQPRHHVLTRLARFFHVVWVNPAHHWRQIPRRLAEPAEPDTGTSEGFTVYRPEAWLPCLYRPGWLARTVADLRLRRARRLLTSRGCRRIVLYLWRPEFEAALGAVPADLTCYHIDDEYSFSDVELPPDPVEQRLISNVDQVFIHSPKLLERKGQLNAATTFVPNGVDYEAYSRSVPEPPDLAAVPRPRIGYTGFLKKQLDWALLLELSGRHPGWAFVFVGPRAAHPELEAIFQELSRRPNVHFLGRKSAAELTAYPQHFDVCILPYRRTYYTDCIYPMKLHEYLATGRPTVGTRIRSLEEFRDVVPLADTAAEWSAALTAALAPEAGGAERCAARRAVAREHDWDGLVERIATMMTGRLGQPGSAARSGRDPEAARR